MNRYRPTTLFWTHDLDGNWKDAGGSPIPSVPMQKSPLKIPEIIAREAYKEYADQGHGSQSFARLHERGGFSAAEIILHLYERIERLTQGKKGDEQ